MGDFPQCRVQISRPFTNTGIDYAGPVILKHGRKITTKAYIALFICMATKAIHLELVSSLSTKEFLAALLRFISRRGKCTNIYSDNATNFHGALNELKRFFKDKRRTELITNKLTDIGIQWHFIPPASPNFGGLWKSGVKTVKNHIKRVLQETPLTFEEFSTLLCQIEACVNSRPLSIIHDTPDSQMILTPAHFLSGESLTIRTPDYKEIPMNRLTRFELTQQRFQHFWQR